METDNYFFEVSEVDNEQYFFVVISYDIYNNRRRNKFSKYLERFAIRVQRSVFEGELTKKKYEKLISGIENHINEEDNVRVYRINGNGSVKVWGKVDKVSMDEVIII